MKRRLEKVGWFAVPCILLLLFSVPDVSAQRVEDSCPAFALDSHQTLECLEAVFTQTDIPYHLPHLTLSSIAPGNGVPLGIEYEERTHYVSSPFQTPTPAGTPSPGYKSLVDATAAAVISTNGSWYAKGGVTWLPPVHYRDETKPNGEVCHRLWILCTKQVLGINFSVSHQTLQALDFYGLGPSAPYVKLTYRENDTYGGVVARMPLTNWLGIDGQIENRKPTVHFSSGSLATNAPSETTAPGISSQPDYMHYVVGVRTNEQAISEPITNDPATTPAGAAPPPLMKPKLIFTFENSVFENWYADENTGHYSFQQFEIDGRESVKLDSVIRRFVPPGAMTARLKALKHFCNDRKSGLKVSDECDFGELTVRPLLVLSSADKGVIPFYLEQTLGGSDIESRPTLRGFDNYRFRAPDAAMVSVDYEIRIIDPIGGLLFYDVGSVADSAGSLSFAHARQDAGLGATVRILNNVVAQGYMGFGEGHGPHFGYNFTKFF